MWEIYWMKKAYNSRKKVSQDVNEIYIVEFFFVNK